MYYQMGDDLYRLTTEQIKQLIDRGYTYVDIGGKIIAVTKEDILFKKDEIHEFVKNMKEGKKNNEQTD